jgi:signal transduction histidine kinase
MEALKQVSNDIAHELRTPLSRLRQSLEDAREKSTSAQDYDAAIASAIDDANGVLETFSALLRIAQIESGTRRSMFADVDLSEMANELVQTYSAIIEDVGKHFSYTIDPHVHVTGDTELLLQLAVNLIENAIRHTPSQSRITLALRGGPDPSLSISDNGPGIAQEHRQKVFERFQRLEHSHASPGSGLGLSIVAAIADLHGLVVTLDNNEPGLRVTVKFPDRSGGETTVAAQRGSRPAPKSRLQVAGA